MFWPLQNNVMLDFIAWEKGMNFRPDFWNIENDNIFRAGDFSIIRGNYSISELPTTSIRSVVDAFFDCAEESTGWIWNCPY